MAEPLTPDEILARIIGQYGMYATMAAFQEGYRAYQIDGAHRRNPYSAAPAGEEALAAACQRGVNGQAWDRGANAAMLYQRAMTFRAEQEALAALPDGVTAVPLDDPAAVHDTLAEAPGERQPDWLDRLLRTGRP